VRGGFDLNHFYRAMLAQSAVMRQ